MLDMPNVYEILSTSLACSGPFCSLFRAECNSKLPRCVRKISSNTEVTLNQRILIREDIKMKQQQTYMQSLLRLLNK